MPQFELEIGSANGVHERQAEAVADAVVDERRPAEEIAVEVGVDSNPPDIQRRCASCAAEDDETLRRSADSSGRTPLLRTGLHSQISMARTQPGKNLPGRDYFESRFGADFGDVRVHSDPRAASLSSALGARAFTVGQDIFFGAGQLDVATKPGRHLLAHELSHTIQQTGQLQRSLEPMSSIDATADAVLEDVISGSLGTISDVEDRVRELTGQELTNLEVLLESSSIDGLDDIDKQTLKEVIVNVRTGAVGQAAVVASSRPCRPGDTKGLSAHAWTSNPTIVAIATGQGPSKLDRSSPADAVRLTQQALIEWGCRLATPARNPFPTSKVDGDYGGETRNAVRQFQRDRGLSVDGWAGPKTLRALGEAVSHAEFRDSIDPAPAPTFDTPRFPPGWDPEAHSSSVIEHFQILGNGPTTRTTSVHIEVVGHASPRWEHPKGGSPADLNLQLSRARANAIRELLPAMLGPKLHGNLDVTLESHSYEHDVPVGVGTNARGSEDTLVEAEGDLRANDPLLRRADLGIEFTDMVHAFGGISVPGDTYETPSQCERERSTKWAVTFTGAASAAVGGAVGGATGNLLKYTDDGESVRGWKIGAVGAVLGPKKLPVSLTASLPGWTDFETYHPMTFHDFDGQWVKWTSMGFTPLIGYSWTDLGFYEFGTKPSPIETKGLSFGFDAGISTLHGHFSIWGDPPQCDDTRGEETAGMSTAAHSMHMDTSQFVHRTLFESGEFTLSLVEMQRLNAALSSMVAEHRLFAENDTQTEVPEE